MEHDHCTCTRRMSHFVYVKSVIAIRIIHYKLLTTLKQCTIGKIVFQQQSQLQYKNKANYYYLGREDSVQCTLKSAFRFCYYILRV